MSYADVENDYLHWENPQTVTLTARRVAGNTTDVLTDGAVRRPITKARHTFGEVQLTGVESYWVLAAVLIVNAVDSSSNLRVEPNDTITHGSDVWTIQRVELLKFESQVHCLCVKQP